MQRDVVEHCDVYPVMALDRRTRIGHVHLTVSDLDRALAFYQDVLGFDGDIERIDAIAQYLERQQA